MAVARTSTCVLAAALLVGAAVGTLSCGPVSTTDDRARVLRSAAAYLWAQQGEDGGWHSATYSLLRGGETWTPFVAHYLFMIPDSVYRVPGKRRKHAIQFIREHVSSDGVLGVSDPTVLEYPNYASSYALRVLRRWGARDDSSLISRMSHYLLEQQYTESRGIDPMHPAYGSWGFGEMSLPLGHVGHIDLSHTRRVLEAIAVPELRGEHHMKALRFLHMLQKHRDENRPQPGSTTRDPRPPYDGGFYASTVTLGMNKGGTVADSSGLTFYPSYGTTTCDGVLALLAAGVPRDDERVLRALDWLTEHSDLTRVQGIPRNPSQWEHVMFYYHLLVRSEANIALGMEGAWREEIFHLLAERQKPDGSFENPLGSLNKEDDPILATAMATGALLNTL